MYKDPYYQDSYGEPTQGVQKPLIRNIVLKSYRGPFDTLRAVRSSGQRFLSQLSSLGSLSQGGRSSSAHLKPGSGQLLAHRGKTSLKMSSDSSNVFNSPQQCFGFALDVLPPRGPVWQPLP